MSTLLPEDVQTLGEMFEHAADRHPAGEARTFFAQDALAYGDLARNGRIVARNLIAAGVEPGTPLAVLIRSGLELLQAINGITAAGAIIVPLPVPLGAGKSYLARLRHVIADSGVTRAVVDDVFAEHFAGVLPDVETLTVSSLIQGEDRGPLPVVSPDGLALVQYTSGSTSDPRGVALSHRNVLAGIRALHAGTEARHGDIVCHWLPLSHDMGLFSTLAAVGAGIDIRISSPEDFVKHPDEWLQQCCEFGATVLVGPNFYYRYLIDAIEREEAADYDLSAVRVMINGAEAVDPSMAADFAEHFAAAGIAPNAMTPCYGLAEATLAVTIAPVGGDATVDWVDRDALSTDRRARPVDPADPDARGIVNCGTPVPGIEVRIAKDGRAVADRVVGDVEIRGEPVMGGYYREPTPSVGPDGWCPTGDLGYLADSCLFVTGRTKEMLIFGGRNYYPQDVEDAVRRVDGVYKRYAVAVVLPADPDAGRPERIGVLAAVDIEQARYSAVASAIREAAAQELGGASVDVVLLRRNGLLRTTSGKFQRMLMRQQLIGGTLDRVLVQIAADEHLSDADKGTPSLV